MAQFFGNIKILSQDLFQTTALNKKSEGNLFSYMLNKNDEMEDNIMRDDKITKKENNIIKDEKKTEEIENKKELDKEIIKEKDYFSLESIHDRLRIYAKKGGVPLDLVEGYSQHRKMKIEVELKEKKIEEKSDQK